MIRQMFKEIVEYRELLLALTYRDIRVKYKQAVMGVLWVFFMPALAILSGVMIRIAMAFITDSPLLLEDVGKVMARTQPWLLFVGVLGVVSGGLLSGMGLASKIYFPRQIIPLSGIMGYLFDFTISSTALIVLLTVLTIATAAPGPVQVTPYLLLVPVLLTLILMMALGLGLVFGSLNLFFRDVKYIVSMLLQFAIFFTPVYWFVSDMGRFGEYMLFNPMAPLIEAISSCVIGYRAVAGGETLPGMDPTLWPYLAYSAVFAITALTVGINVFRKSEPLFAEVM